MKLCLWVPTGRTNCASSMETLSGNNTRSPAIGTNMGDLASLIFSEENGIQISYNDYEAYKQCLPICTTITKMIFKI